MQTVASLKPGCGLTALAPRRAAPAPRRALAVSAKGGKAPSDAPAPAAPPAPPTDIPAYFQPAPAAPQQGQAYQAVPTPQYAPAPAPEGSFWSRIPPLVYIGVGVVLAGVLGKVMELVKGGPQKMQQMAMEQMMKQMMKQMGAPPGGASPFGGAGANPFGAAGANPFGAAGGASPFGAGSPSGFPSSFPNPPVFDTTATPAAPAAAAAAAPAAPAAPAAETSSASSSAAPAADKPKKRSSFVDVGSKSGSSSSSSTASSSAGTAEPAAAAAAAPASSSMPPPPFNMPPPPGGMPPPPFNMPPPPAGGAAGAGAAAGAGDGGMAGTMLEMLKNPEMQKMLYPYLPEPMRNPETFDWMLSNPEYRQQLEGMLQQQVMSSGSPAMAEMMQGMNMSPEKMQAQFDALGMTPDQFIGKVMADPDLAGMMTNPKIMAAIAECTKNPMAIFNYQNDPEVLRVFEKMSQLFPQAAGAGALPTMPPGMGMPPTQQ